MFFSWHRYRTVSTDVLITSHLQASGVLSGQQQDNTCDLEMMSSIAKIAGCMADSLPSLHIHYTISCINTSMVHACFSYAY